MITIIKLAKFIRKNIIILSAFTLSIYLLSSIFHHLMQRTNDWSIDFLESLITLTYLIVEYTETLLIWLILAIIIITIIEIIIRQIYSSSIGHILKEMLLSHKIRKNFISVVEDGEINKNTVRNYNKLISSTQIFITRKAIVVQISANANNDAMLKLKEKLPEIKEEFSFSNNKYVFSEFERIKNKYVLNASRKLVKPAQRR